MVRGHASFILRFVGVSGVGLAVVMPAGCLDHPVKPVEYELSQELEANVPISINRDVDILFVIDNSGSMGEEQATLARNFSAFIDVLEEEQVDANYRIGITTTDNGHVSCHTNAAGGRMLMSSCRSRQQDFVSGDNDATQEACLDICPEDLANIEIQPTTTHLDATPRPRTWLERIAGTTNLPDGLSTTQAFQCLGPQGINGCGYEQPLESMYKALQRARIADEDQYGFLRDNAILAIVFVTDEADCSHRTPDFDSMFLADGDRTFWSDPTLGYPTSAVCWNAAVECTGSGGPYDDCQSASFDERGNPVPEEEGVMRPVSRYIDLIAEIEREKKELHPDQEVLVAGIVGVRSDGSALYQNTVTDPDFQTDYGIGPGCTSAAGEAVPPVRLRELAEAFAVEGEQNLFSICDDDYSVALKAVADRIKRQLRPPCMPACVADTDPTTPRLEPSCVLEEEYATAGGERVTTTIHPCNDDGSLPDGADACFRTLTEPDEMSAVCRDEGWNLEFALVRSGPEPSGSAVRARCELSQQAAVDCPAHAE